MALLYANEKPATRQGEVNDKFVRTYRVEYVCQSDVENEDPVLILADGLLPQHNQTLLYDQAARVVNRSAKQREGSFVIWDVVIDWSTEADEGGGDDAENPNTPYDPDDPLTFPAEISVRSTTETKAAVWGYLHDGTNYSTTLSAIINSAGDDFDPPAERQIPKIQLQFGRNYAKIPDFVFTHINSLNTAAFTFAGHEIFAYEARVADISVSKEEQHKKSNGGLVTELIRYFHVTVTLELDDDPESFNDWSLRILDQGYHYLDNGTKKRIELDGAPASAPQLLDGSGGILANPSQSTASYRRYRIYDDDVSWSDMGIPQ